MHINYKHANTCTKKARLGECSLSVLYISDYGFFFFFYNQHIFIGKWKKQKITEKKWKGNIFEGRGDQNSGVGYPASPSLHKDQWLDSCP